MLNSNKPRPKTAYEKTRDVWYDKLKKSGFKDIEKNEYDLIRSSLPLHMSVEDNIRKKEELESYYRIADNFLNDYEFTDNITKLMKSDTYQTVTRRKRLRLVKQANSADTIEKIIWEYHTNGLKLLEIVAVLKKVQRYATSRSAVYNILRKFKESMKRMYLSSQVSE